MKKFISAFILAIVSCGIINTTIINPPVARADDIDKILQAKEKVRQMVNHPDTLVFHEFSTKVVGNTVTLKFTCKNGFGVPETHTMDIKVN
jgi:hypothetical protein